MSALWDRTIVTNDLPAEETELMRGPVPPPGFVSNGCSFVPDRYGDLRMDAPCHWHDYHYALGGGWNEFREANYWFRRNLRAVGTPRFVVWARWVAVWTAGIPFFSWDSELEPRTPVIAASWAACRVMGGDPRGVLQGKRK
jgi:hypothetical protein